MSLRLITSGFRGAASLGRAVQCPAAHEFVTGLLPIVTTIRATGATTLESMAQSLNQRGIRSAHGGKGYYRFTQSRSMQGCRALFCAPVLGKCHGGFAVSRDR